MKTSIQWTGWASPTVYVSVNPVEGRHRLVQIVYRYAGLAEVRETTTGKRWLVGTHGKRGWLTGYKEA